MQFFATFSAVFAIAVFASAAVAAQSMEPIEPTLRQAIDQMQGVDAQQLVNQIFDAASPDENAVKGSQLLDAFAQNKIDPYLGVQALDIDRDGLITRTEFTQIMLTAMDRVPASSAADQRVTGKIQEVLDQTEATKCPRKY